MSKLDANQLHRTATGQWRGILESAGIPAGLLNKRHGACPICGGHDRFRFDDKNGRGTFYCNQCGAGDGFRLLELHRGGGFPDALEFVAHRLGYSQDAPAPRKTPETRFVCTDNTAKTQKPDNRQRITEIWRGAIPDHPLLATYLEKRGCKPAALPADVRLHPRLEYWHDGSVIGHFPAAVALVKDSQGKVKGLHRIYLDSDGAGKAHVPGSEKKLLALHEGATSGCCVHLYPFTQGTLAVAEGIETALAIRCAMPMHPVWATVSAGNIAAMQPPEKLKELMIFADLDRSDTGENAAHRLAERAAAAGIKCKVLIPGEADARRVFAVRGILGKSVDWLDVWNCAAVAHGEAA